MIPLGVFGYAQAGPSADPLHHHHSIWSRPKSPKAKRAQARSGTAATISFARALRKDPFPGASSTASSTPPVQPASSAAPGSPPPRSKPKHIPIVIPRYVPILAPDSPCRSTESSPARTFASASSEGPSCLDFPLPDRKPSAESGKLKPRHVEILIPDWAQPVQTLPDSPISAPSDSPSDLTPPSASQKEFSSPLMARQTPNISRANTMDSQTSAPSPSQLYSSQFQPGNSSFISSNSSQTSLHQYGQEPPAERAPKGSISGPASGGPSPALQQTAGLNTPSNGSAGLSGLVCNVHRTTGREPHPLVGATTTILGDKLYVFGGRRLSRTRPTLTSDLYELDLVKRHWTKVETKGDIPPPRYFHSVCALGDTKLVCYGGMSPSGTASATAQAATTQDGQPEVVVMSDIHIYDVPTKTWTHVPTTNTPQGRYAHCATILPSSAVFTSQSATKSAIHHNPSSANPNHGSIGVALDGTGGAEMVVVGGQDSANHYIEQISVFNLRNLTWTSTEALGKSCGAYRSVVAPLTTMEPALVGAGRKSAQTQAEEQDRHTPERSAMLIYSNYNFLDVKLELQIRLPDGSLVEKPMHGNYSPPGLRFPNGGVVDSHFVVSGTFLTSSKQEYALWALDLRTLTWSRIDAGGNIFSQGSWNRGILWNRRNTFVILGNRKRSLVEDYNHRRINFSNICMVELEAFGLYDNPRKTTPSSGYLSVSSPAQLDKLDHFAGGRKLQPAADALGQMALGMRELSDMDFLAIGGERIPVNSRLVARRWGPYFNQLLREGVTSQETTDTATLRPATGVANHRMSSITITPSIKTSYSTATTLTANTVTSDNSVLGSATSPFAPPDPRTLPPAARPRTLYLPHTHLTIQALVHYLYTSSLPPHNSPLCTPQILCSLLQLARPYRIDGLLEAVIERLHFVLDGRNTAAIFNAAAMAAGGGDGVSFFNTLSLAANEAAQSSSPSTAAGVAGGAAAAAAAAEGDGSNGRGQPLTQASLQLQSSGGLEGGMRRLRINTDVHAAAAAANGGYLSGTDDELSSAGTETSASELGPDEREIWAGTMSAVVGLQKRGLRGLMEGRRIREMGRGGGVGGAMASAGGGAGAGGAGGAAGVGGMSNGEDRVGLGIA